jgi:CBS domain-containing protein/sporulation protein YlmC with PRC-barrel domain
MSTSVASQFASAFLGRPVIDKSGAAVGQLWDLCMERSERRLPHISGLVVKQAGKLSAIPWTGVDLFTARIIAVDLTRVEPAPFDPESAPDILVRRDILDKQIVDVEGARLVRVNDLRIEARRGALCVTAVDAGMRGLARRLGQEKLWSSIAGLFKRSLPRLEIGWEYVQPLHEKATGLALRVSREKLADMHPADLADIISQLPHSEAETVLLTLDHETAGEALAELDTEVGGRILSRLDKEYASDILEEMAPDSAADVLTEMSDDHAQELLELMDNEDAEKIQELMEHEEDTAGGIMVNEFVALPPDMPAEEALAKVRSLAEELEYIYYVYVLDAENKPLGTVGLRDILAAKPGQSLRDLMIENLKTVPVDASADDVLDLAEKYGLLAVPVLKEDGTMAGVVTADDMLSLSLSFALRWKRIGRHA